MKAHTKTTRRVAHVLMAALTAFLLLLSVAPGADAKGDQTKKDTSTEFAATTSCPSGWVLGRHGCQPGNYTIEEVVYYDAASCAFLDKWVTASVPGHCLPNTFGIDKGEHVYAVSYTCPIEFNCEGYEEIMTSFGLECFGHNTGIWCHDPNDHDPVRPLP